MIKHSCDICGAEIQGDHSQMTAETTLRTTTGRSYQLIVSIAVVGTIEEKEHPEMCSACVFRAVDQVNPLPRGLAG